MSRIGRLPIPVPAGVTVTIADDNTVTVKGPKGELSQKVNKDIKVEQVGSEIHRYPSVRQQAPPLDAWFVSLPDQ